MKYQQLVVPCRALSHGMCKNGSHANNSASDSNLVYSPPSCDVTIVSKDFIDSKLQLAFGATILRDDGNGLEVCS